MYKKILKNLTPNAFLVIGCILAGCIFLYAVGLRQSASSIGNGVGVSAGTVVGKAIGSWEGLTRGSSEGEKAGREEGLSAEDTLISISNRIHQMEKLEVLAADVKLKNFHTIGKQQDYAALYLASGNVVFTVDLSRAKTSQQGNTFKIMLPDAVNNTLSAIASCNTALSMFVIGGILSEVDKASFLDKDAFIYSFYRLILLPLIILIIVKIIHIDLLPANLCVLLSAMPVASTTAMLAQKYNGNAIFASKLVFVSTLLSLITLPIITLLFS